MKGMGVTLAALLALLVGVVVTQAPTSPPEPAPTVTVTETTEPGTWHPIEAVTPGKVLTTNADDVCTPGWAGKHREYLREAEERQLRAAYGLATDAKVSEWDHLVSLQLGGDNGPRNVWPQVDHAQDQRKDRLETRLHWAVCRGELSLPEAQDRIEHFWRWW